MNRLGCGAILFLALMLAMTGLVRAENPGHAAVEGLVTHMLKAWETDDVGAFSGAFRDDAVFAYPGGRLTRPELTEMFKKFQVENKDIKIYMGLFLVEGNRFAGQYQFASTNRQSGKRTAVGTAVAGVVKDGKLEIYKEFYDQHILNWQVEGRIPLDEGQVFPAPASITMGPERIN